MRLEWYQEYEKGNSLGFFRKRQLRFFEWRSKRILKKLVNNILWEKADGFQDVLLHLDEKTVAEIQGRLIGRTVKLVVPIDVVSAPIAANGTLPSSPLLDESGLL